MVLQLKQCEVGKEDDHLILSILSKIGLDYSVFVSTFHTGNLTTPNWKMSTLNAFIVSLTIEHDKLVQMGIIKSSKDQALFASGPKIQRVKESRRIKRLNLMLQRLKKRINSKNILSAQRNTRTKETKEKRKSSVPIERRDSTLNMPT